MCFLKILISQSLAASATRLVSCISIFTACDCRFTVESLIASKIRLDSSNWLFRTHLPSARHRREWWQVQLVVFLWPTSTPLRISSRVFVIPSVIEEITSASVWARVFILFRLIFAAYPVSFLFLGCQDSSIVNFWLPLLQLFPFNGLRAWVVRSGSV